MDYSITPYYEYPFNIEDVPDSILIIPFLGNLIPLALATHADIHVKSLDSSFYNAFPNIIDGYKKVVPMVNFSCNIFVEDVVVNSYKATRNSLLFSGGIDTFNTLFNNYENIDELITVWGSDIRTDNIEGWNNLSMKLKEEAVNLNKDLLFVKSNFRDYINEFKLGELIKETKDSWWHAMQHGIALLSHSAPLMFLRQYEVVYIASTYTADFNPICASHPLIDNEFRCASSRVIHDSYEYDRCQKVENIYNYLHTKSHLKLNIHVCWMSKNGFNCGSCEKCTRTYLNIKSINEDPKLIGLDLTISQKDLKKKYLQKTFYNNHGLYRLRVMKKAIKRHFIDKHILIPQEISWIYTTDFSKLNNSFLLKINRFLLKIRGILGRIYRIIF